MSGVTQTRDATSTREGAQTYRVLLVEDDDAFAGVLADLLGVDGRVEIVGRARNGAEATMLARKLRPDVVVMDIEMPVMDGVEPTRRILGYWPSARIVALSGLDYSERVLEVRNAGAYDYVRKSRLEDDLIDAINAAARRNQ